MAVGHHPTSVCNRMSSAMSRLYMIPSGVPRFFFQKSDDGIYKKVKPYIIAVTSNFNYKSKRLTKS